MAFNEICETLADRTNGEDPARKPRSDFDRRIELLALLEDPMRRSLYAYVVKQADYVSRDEAAGAVGIGRGLAAFHLDKLAEEGLLETIYRRPAGRVGPGAGRPAKLYRRSQTQVSVSLPPRDYELIARLLATALEQQRPASISAELTSGARAAGAALAAEARKRAGRRANKRRLVESGLEVLRDQGYEPKRTGPDVELLNCPFFAVAHDHRELVCPMNLAMLDAFAGDLRVSGLTARPVPHDSHCCVSINVGTRHEPAAASP